MKVTLHVVSSQSAAMGAAATHTFDEQGGSIGRIDSNDWVLPDADRFVSSTHAGVTFEAGDFYLTDRSTNGTFVNDPGFLVGNGNTVPLNDGDRLFIGDYEIVASVEDSAQTGPSPGASMTTPPPAVDPFAGGIDAGQGGSLDPMASMFGSDADPFGATPPAAPQSPSPGAAPAGDADAGLDPLAAFDEPDPIEERPAEQAWPQDAGASPDHSSPLEQSFTPPAAGTPVIPDDDWDKTILPMPEAESPPASEPPPAAPATPPPAGPAPDPTPDPTPRTAPPPAATPSPGATPQAPSPGGPPAGDEQVTGWPPPAGGFAPQAPASAPPLGGTAPADASGAFARPPGAAPGAADPAAAGMALGDGSAEGLQHLLTAAGVDPSRMPPQAANAVFQLAGSVFREVVQGMMEVLQARDALKSELRIARTTIQPRKNNPLKFSVSADEAITKLLFPQEHGYMAPVEALREAIDDIKAHQMAMMAGLRAALTSIMEQFDPEELEDRFQNTLKHSPMAALRGKSKYWEMYEEYYQQLAGDSSASALRLFGEDFAKAYQDQLDKLS